MKRIHLGALAASLAVVAFAFAYYIRTPPTTPNEVFAAPTLRRLEKVPLKSLPLNAAPTSEPASAEPKAGAALPPEEPDTFQKLRKTTSPADRARIDEALQQMWSALKKAESENRSVVFDREYSNDHILTLQIERPTEPQLRKIYEVQEKAAKIFPAGSDAAKLMRKEGQRFIDDEVSYKKAFKVLHVSARRDGLITQLIEYLLDDPTLVRPDANGAYKVPLPPVSIMRSDSHYGEENSWAAKRYAHLLAVE